MPCTPQLPHPATALHGGAGGAASRVSAAPPRRPQARPGHQYRRWDGAVSGPVSSRCRPTWAWTVLRGHCRLTHCPCFTDPRSSPPTPSPSSPRPTVTETAITIDDVVVVINAGRLREKGYDPFTGVSTLQASGCVERSIFGVLFRGGKGHQGKGSILGALEDEAAARVSDDRHSHYAPFPHRSRRGSAAPRSGNGAVGRGGASPAPLSTFTPAHGRRRWRSSRCPSCDGAPWRSWRCRWKVQEGDLESGKMMWGRGNL